MEINKSMMSLLIGSIMFVSLIMVLVIGSNITSNISSGLTATINTQLNESETVVTNVAFQLVNDNVNGILFIRNTSNHNLTLGTDYAFTGSGTAAYAITVNNTVRYNGTYYLDYTYPDRSAAINTSTQGNESFSLFGDYLSIIATIIILVVVVGIMMGVIYIFAKRKE